MAGLVGGVSWMNGSVVWWLANWFRWDWLNLNSRL